LVDVPVASANNKSALVMQLWLTPEQFDLTPPPGWVEPKRRQGK
jgi:hypothetical protein